MKKKLTNPNQAVAAVVEEREKPSWTVDLGSFYVNADTEQEAIQEAMKVIESGQVEVDQVFLSDE